jgi:hypothetical protein
VPPSGIPDAPTDGTQYGRQSGAWTPISVSGGPPVIIAATPPSAASAGDLWWDSVGGQLYVYFTDANSSQWVIAVNVGSSGAGGGASISVGATPPVNPSVGALWWDAVGAQMYLWFNDGNSSQWVPTTNQMAAVSPASTTVLGGVKVDGTSIKAAADGTISTVLIPMGDNRIINGDMWVDQHNAGASIAPVAGSAVVCPDRWWDAQTKAHVTFGQNYNGLPKCPGFSYFLGAQVTSAWGAIAAADYAQIWQTLEGDAISDLMQGTANAQPCTLSFWVNSSVTGTFSVALSGGNATTNRAYVTTYSIPTANVWTKIAITIPGDTNVLAWNTGNAGGMTVGFDLGSGSSFRTSTANAWINGGVSGLSGLTGSVSLVSTLNAKWAVTGVKLEIGNVVTPYNRQSLAKIMIDCQRYYSIVSIHGLITAAGAGSYVKDSVGLPAMMRATPTLVYTPGANLNLAGAVTFDVVTQSGFRAYTTSAAAGTTQFEGTVTCSAEI